MDLNEEGLISSYTKFRDAPSITNLELVKVEIDKLKFYKEHQPFVQTDVTLVNLEVPVPSEKYLQVLKRNRERREENKRK
jgi:hypothetical protein